MKVVVLYAPGDLRVEQKTSRIPPEGWVQVKVLRAGICGSDLHNFRTGKWMTGQPVTPGHELFGVVTGQQNSATFANGCRVVADSRVWCEECDACQRQDFQLCQKLGFVGEVFDGGFAEQVWLPERNLLRVPDEVPDDIAVLSEPLGVALRVVTQLNPPNGATVKVAGGGTIGGLVALLLHHLKGCKIQLAEPNSERYQRLAAVIPLQPAGQFSYAVEATGIASVLRQLSEQISAGGKIALVGIFHDSAGLDFNYWVEREISLVGCSVFRDEQRDALGIMAELTAELRQLTAPVIPLDDVPAAYQRLLAGQSGYLKTVIQP
ncbi:zinc-dependent alcohol dehydrogenase [Tatumella citrea]|uniref:Alcohol dehydrogenase n=1 Tax=Tatumella citrea TaxID=53336 RepID=A0A1Y0L7K3_TATCI|nr:alcohol dehydrogenase catalytic domain-containing protein [Tatumella citrea]ARU94011.1 alcohol dehydrogenase [Tatumella citrea]ARU98049.1 alcohol dehydrogenase [Tatumella citrea]